MSKPESITEKKPRVFLGREAWTKHFLGYQQSGLTQNQYAEKHHLNPTTFKNWISRFKREKQSRAGTTPTFIPLKVTNRPLFPSQKRQRPNRKEYTSVYPMALSAPLRQTMRQDLFYPGLKSFGYFHDRLTQFV